MTEDKPKNNYLFPNILAEMMKKVSLQVQYEASLMSMTLIMIGLGVSGVYVCFYTAFPLWYKIFLTINVLAGFVFLSSFLVTTFQQYQTYMKAVEFQKQYNSEGGNENAKENNL